MKLLSCLSAALVLSFTLMAATVTVPFGATAFLA